MGLNNPPAPNAGAADRNRQSLRNLRSVNFISSHWTDMRPKSLIDGMERNNADQAE